MVDDHSRLAYAEVLEDLSASCAVGFLHRAVTWFAERGVRVEAVMTDNGACYIAHAYGAALARARSPPPADPAPQTAHQRQGRALHPDTAERVGLRPHLRQLS